MRFLVLASLLILQGCSVITSQPLAPNVPEEELYSLAGRWLSNNGLICIEAIPDPDDSRLRVLYMEEDGSLAIGFSFGLTRLGEQDFLSGPGYELAGDTDQEENLVLAYRLVYEGGLEAAVIDFATARRAVEAGEIEGRVVVGSRYDSVMITASPEVLAAWLVRGGESLLVYDERIRFQRQAGHCRWWPRYEALRRSDPAAVEPAP